MLARSAKDSRSSSGSYMDEQQMGQQTTFTLYKPPHSPKRSSPLKQSMRISSLESDKNVNLRHRFSAEYLQELRSSRVARLNGSRPAPPSRIASKRQRPASNSVDETHMSANTSRNEQADPEKTEPGQVRPHTRARSVDTYGINSFAGRPLVAQPYSNKPVQSSSSATDASLSKSNTPAPIYMENGQRWMERQEAHSLRLALEDMDMNDEERIHTAAQDEAAELVWKHRNGKEAERPPSSAYKNPDVVKDAPKRDYHSHLRKGSYTRSHVLAQAAALEPHIEEEPSPPRPKTSDSRSTPVIANSHDNDPFVDDKPELSPRRPHSKGKTYEKLASAVASDVAASRRRASSGANRIPSGDQKAVFASAEVKIFEEPDEQLKDARIAEAEKAAEKANETPVIPRHVRRNPFARVRQAQEKFEKRESPSGYSVKRYDADDSKPYSPNSVRDSSIASSPSNTSSKPVHRVEIQKNTPTQSRKAWYLTNEPVPPTPPKEKTQEDVEAEIEDAPRAKDGVEIRGDDIRAATSMRRKDRSPALIQPTAVSDSPGRPIVSFQRDWKPKEIELVEAKSATAPHPSSSDKITPSDTALGGKYRTYAPSPTKTPPMSDNAPAKQAPALTPRGFPPTRQETRGLPSVAKPTTEIVSPWTNTSRTPIAKVPSQPIPTIVVAESPSIPSIVLPEEPEVSSITFQVNGNPAIPVINEPSLVEEPEIPRPRTAPSSGLARPLPEPVSRPLPSARPLPTTANSSPFPAAAAPHYTPSLRRTTALCAHCALPIAGRILSAAGERFHPACFKCHTCATNLECVAFYPEPDQKRAQRVARILQRRECHDVRLPEGVTEEDVRKLEESDGDEALRFFCHLDFHELFSPRCKSCKTPIEGEVIVACGAEWHAGHFFCAQCGDPFDSRTPFVEKDGYAWCVGCHTNRYSAKCRKCKRPVTDVVVKALGSEWHADCFCCMECGGQFDDGRYFLRGSDQDPVCIRCEERRLKA
ncbi:hypothetical protein MBLNU459_g6986t2 [Dothideomycetes sp. NU459]